MKTLYKKLFTTAALASLTSAALAQDIHSDDTLPPLSLTLGNVTVSGMSSGGYMATQFHVAHSDWVKGAGILAAGPYYCAKGDITTALAQCVNKVDGDIDLNALQQVAKAFEKEEKIAPLSNLSDFTAHKTRGSSLKLMTFYTSSIQCGQTMRISSISVTSQWLMYFLHNQRGLTACKPRARLLETATMTPLALC